MLRNSFFGGETLSGVVVEQEEEEGEERSRTLMSRENFSPLWKSVIITVVNTGH